MRSTALWIINQGPDEQRWPSPSAWGYRLDVGVVAGVSEVDRQRTIGQNGLSTESSAICRMHNRLASCVL